jgi:hypothetical protein
MTTPSSDASLVAGHLARDPSALVGMYDRYSDPLHDAAAAMLNHRVHQPQTASPKAPVRWGPLRSTASMDPASRLPSTHRSNDPL